MVNKIIIIFEVTPHVMLPQQLQLLKTALDYLKRS